MHLLYKTANPFEFQKVKDEKTMRLWHRRGWSEVSPTELGKKLRVLRDRLDFTQSEMATYVSMLCAPHFKVQERQYRRWEQGESLQRFMSLENFLVLSQSLCIPITFLTQTSAALPGLWHQGTALTDATHPLGKEPVAGFDLRLYVVTLEDRVSSFQHTVLAKNVEDARRFMLHASDEGRISSIKEAKWDEGVVTSCGTRR